MSTSRARVKRSSIRERVRGDTTLPPNVLKCSSSWWDGSTNVALGSVTGICRKAAARFRSAELSRTNRPIYAGFRTDFRVGRHGGPTDQFEAK
jgi:hypothetical protein